MSARHHLVTSQLENISWKVLEQYRDVIKEMIRGKSGIYALYNRDKLYYVGLASNLMTRLNQHLKDRHKRKWDKFSVYLTKKDEHMKELESLFLRIMKPTGNKVIGKFGGSVNLRQQLNKSIKSADDDKRAGLLGGAIARNRRRSVTRNTRGTTVLAGLVGRKIGLRAYYKDYYYFATLTVNGKIRFDGDVFESPTAAAKMIIEGRSVSGWNFWRYKDKKSGDWVPLANLRK
ncbi:MAG: hypothetical protein DRR42_28405 [Gammaproteobacteria bacterium]|nr:MAG: hypothetical protein DRR42_28405 [Gammaproteobacteria bacterium]